MSTGRRASTAHGHAARRLGRPTLSRLRMRGLRSACAPPDPNGAHIPDQRHHRATTVTTRDRPWHALSASRARPGLASRRAAPMVARDVSPSFA
jgi:hypothetical protein